jgi:hypothetical protein
MIASLPISSTQTPAVAVSRSTDAMTWQNPVSVDLTSASSDKNWIVCDSWASSPYYGNCYLEWDEPPNDEIFMSTSSRRRADVVSAGAYREPGRRNRRPAFGAAERDSGGTDRSLCFGGPK